MLAVESLSTQDQSVRRVSRGYMPSRRHAVLPKTLAARCPYILPRSPDPDDRQPLLSRVANDAGTACADQAFVRLEPMIQSVSDRFASTTRTASRLGGCDDYPFV
jgi:hypothetical protein